ncbi:MAG: L-2-amino-thiazoline-4-carboxylic acid hydrolase [Dehalococcoidales bacterium]
MDTAKQVQLLQAAYAGALADTMLQFSKEGVIARVTERKHVEQMATGKQRLAAFGITKPEEVFLNLSEVFGCARWEITDKSADGFVARSGSCKLCAFAKKLGAPSPCHLYCLDPMEGLMNAIAPAAVYKVEATLWEGNQCRVRVCIAMSRY